MFFQLHEYTVHQPTLDTPFHPRIAHDTKYKEYFKDCVGALDGTHIAAWVSLNQAPFIEIGKVIFLKICLQYVILTCNLHMCFLDGKDLLMIVEFLKMLL